MRLPGPIVALGLQLFPIVVFLVVDSLVQDPRWAIVAALAFVVLQAIITFARGKGFDRFLLLDLLLVGGMGAASLLTRNEVFFKLKPAILEGVMVPYLLFLALARQSLLLGYFDRHAVGVTVSAERLPVLRRLLGMMGALVALHAALVVVAALLWSKRTWGLVSGPGFYVLLVPLVGWSLVQRLRLRRQAQAQESAPAQQTGLPPRPLTSRRRRRGRAH
jgi:intracellular septation protein A